MNISQSLIKTWQEYADEETCGSVLEAKYITKTWDRTWGDSDSKALGRYFEFLLTGAKPTGYDEYPEPKFMKSATEFDIETHNVNKMLSAYRTAVENARKVKELLKSSGFEIERSQVYLTRKIGKVTIEGNIDAEAIYTPPRGGHKRKVNLDIKYSGLMNDKWSKFGWLWTPLQKQYNAIQAAHYQLLNDRATFFLVCSSTNTEDLELYEMRISKEKIQEHKSMVQSLHNKMQGWYDFGGMNYPSLTKCSKCPLKGCPDRVDKLVPTKIEY